MNRIFAIIIFLIGLITYIFAPIKYDYDYSIICGVLYTVIILMYYTVRKKNNFLDFDSLFFFTFFFVMLYFPIFMYETDAQRYFMFAFPFDANVIPRASALSILGVSSYIFGSLFLISDKTTNYYKKNINNYNFKLLKIIPNSKLYIASIILFVLYVITGGYTEMRAMYSGEKVAEASGISNYLFIFCPAFLCAAIIIEFYNLKIKNKDRFKFKNVSMLAYVSISVILLAMILTGSRTLPLQILLIIFGLFTLTYKNIGLVKFVSFMLLGLILMFSVVLLRGYDQDSKVTYGDAVMDLVINNRSSFLSIENVDKKGVTYGSSMLAGISSPIPFLQNFLIESGFDKNKISSSKYFTEYTFGDVEEGFGLGTNVIADIYLAFGALGVFVLMTFLGYYVNVNRLKYYTSIYHLAIYAVFISYAVYLVRAEYFFFLRNLVWVVCIIFITKNKFRFI